MATTFKNKNIVSIGTVPVDILETTGAQRSTVVGMSLTNLTTSFVYVTVKVEDDTSVKGHYLKDVLIPANTSLRAVNGGEKLILAPTNKITVESSLSDSIDCLLSYVEIT
jgi:hypothetical protein